MLHRAAHSLLLHGALGNNHPHSSTTADYVGWFHFGAVINTVTRNAPAHVFWQTHVCTSPGGASRAAAAGSQGGPELADTAKVFQRGFPTWHLPNQFITVQAAPHLCHPLVLSSSHQLFWWVPDCGVNMHFPDEDAKLFLYNYWPSGFPLLWDAVGLLFILGTWIIFCCFTAVLN